MTLPAHSGRRWRVVTLCAALVLATTGVKVPAVWAQKQTLTASDGVDGDFFGLPIAISGNTLVVSAPGDDVTVANQGSVRVFVRDSGVWIEQQTLTTSDATALDGFGGAVAINGNTIVVGASGHDGSRGAAYVFVERGGVFNQAQKLVASDRAANDLFGTSVAINGTTLVVGAMGDDGNRGAAHVFAQTDGLWIEQQKLTAGDRSVPAFPFDTFGRSVVLSGDTIIVGTPRNGIGAPTAAGAAYVFQLVDGAWRQRQKLTASDDGPTNRFGDGLALSGETLVIGAPGANNDRGAVYVFARDTAGVWIEQQKVVASDGLTGDSFGLAVALRGGSLLVGAAGDDVGPNNNQGSAYVFSLTNGFWTEQQKLTASDGATRDGLGFSVELRGNELLVGTHLDTVAGNTFQGSVRVFGVTTATPLR